MQTTFQSGGRTIRLEVYEPHHTVHRGEEQPMPAILLLHGAGGNTGFWLERIVPPLAAAGWSVFAVHYFDRTGTSRAEMRMFSDGVHVPQWLETVAETVKLIAARPEINAARIALVGVSLGAFLSLALASADALPIAAVVDVSGGLVPPFAEQATERFPPTLILHGDADSVVPVSFARALGATLERLRVPHELHVLRGEGHWFSGAAQARILALTAEFLREVFAAKVVL